jgi:Gas vesicle synthesis protein GvpL/GvpF
MPVLLYGIIESGSEVLTLQPGVAGATIQTTGRSDLQCFYSHNSTLPGSAPREAVLEFHRVVQAIFSARDMIPFRFPTLMADEAELASQLQEHAAEYHLWLARVRGRVQMEIRIHYRDDGPGSRKEAGGAVSGTEYLRFRQARQAKLDAAAGVLKGAVLGHTTGWRQRGSSDHLRCFALVGRDSVAQFQRSLASTEIPADLIARVSGPWPPTEFFSEE